MALIKCPECKNDVSDMAISCPHCGCPKSEFSRETTVLNSIEFTYNPNNFKLGTFNGLNTIENYKGRDKYLSIPSNTNYIKGATFKDCQTLEEIILPDTMMKIGGMAFSGCKNLRRIIIPEGVIEIEMVAFAGCEKLEEITLPHSLKIISFGAFRGCSNLKKVIIPDGVVQIGFGAFENCSSLETVTLFNGLYSIGGGAFRNCVGLKNISIPSTVSNIDKTAFCGCENLKTVHLNTQKHEHEFLNCFNENVDLVVNEDVIISKNDNWKNAIKTTKEQDITYIFNTIPSYDCEIESGMLKKYLGTDSYIAIPEGVTKIKSYAFDSNKNNIRGILLPDSLIEIDEFVFENFSQLETVQFPNHMVKIPDGIFTGCSRLKHITLPNGMECIPKHAFEDCYDLESVNLPNTLYDIGEWAFASCKSLKSISIPDDTTISENVFWGTPVTITSSALSPSEKYANTYHIDFRYRNLF